MATARQRRQTSRLVVSETLIHKPVFVGGILQLPPGHDEPGGGVASDEQVSRFAQEHGMSDFAARETIEAYQKSPSDPQFQPLSRAEKADLQAFTRPAPGVIPPPGTVTVGTRTDRPQFISQEDFDRIKEKLGSFTASVLKEKGLAAYNLQVKNATEKLKAVGAINKAGDLNVSKAVENEITLGTMRLAGYVVSKSDVKTAKRVVETTRQLNEANLIDNQGRLNITEAVRSGISIATMRAAGYNVTSSQTREARETLTRPIPSKRIAVGMMPVAPPDIPKEPPKEYDLVAEIKAGNRSKMEKLFPEETIKEAEALIKAEEDAAALRVARHKLELWRHVRTGKVVTLKERNAIIARRPAARDEYVQEQPALILAIDPKWQELKDKPTSDPQRQAYLEKWKRKVADTAMFASFAATPFLPTAVGFPLMKTLPPAISGAMKAASFITTGGTGLARLPVISAIPRVATQVIVGLSKLAVTPAPTAYLVASTIDESNARQLQTNWETFETLPDKEKNKWANKAGYGEEKFAQLSDPQKAVVLTHYSAPSEKALETWLKGIGSSAEKMNEVANKGADWLEKNAPAPLIAPVKVAEGVSFLALGVVEGVHYLAALPIVAANIVDKTPTGGAKEFAGTMALGMAAFFGSIPALVKARPLREGARFAGMFLISPKALIKLGKGLGYNIKPSTIKGLGRAIAIEFSTTRVTRLGKASQAQMLKVMTGLVKQLAEGRKEATAKLGEYAVKVRNVPFQIGKPGRFWHFTPDATKFPAGKNIKLTGKRLYLSTQAAERFAVQSAAGKRMKHPGLVEVVVSKKYQPELHKLLSRGEAELETAIRNRTLDYVGQRQGYSLVLGNYPIRQYTLRGDAVSTKALKMSPKEWLKIEALTAKEYTLDVVLGWGKRMEAAKRLFAKDPGIKRIDEAISELKASTPEVIGKHGGIIEPRQSIPHPSGRGRIKPRVTAVVRNSKGDIMLVKDVTEQSFGLPGGQVDIKYKPGKLGFKKLPDGSRVLTPEGAAHGQVKSETGIGLFKTKHIGTYLGKINDYALSGSRVYSAIAKTEKFKLKKTEIKDAKWWDGQSEITVYPATFDIMKGLAKRYKLDMSKVKIDKTLSVLNKARDKAIVKRLREGKPLTDVALSELNQKEFKSLRKRKADIVRGRSPELADYFLAEPDWKILTDLLIGRQKAVRIKRTIEDIPEWQWSKAQKVEIREILNLAATREIKGEYPTPAERSKLINDFVVKLEKRQEAGIRGSKERQKIIEEVIDYTRREYPYQYNRGYTAFMRPIVAGLARRKAGVSPEKYIRSAIATRTEPPPEFDRRAEVTAEKEYRTIGRREGIRRIDLPLKRIPIKADDRPERPPIRPPERPPIRPPEKPPERPPEKPPERPPEKPPEKPPPPPPVILPKMSAKQKREVIEKTDGAIAWRQGELRGKDVWHVIVYPYDKKIYHAVLIGDKPVGANVVEGPESAFKTAQFISGEKAPDKPINIDMGIFDVNVDAVGKQKIRLEFTPDPEQKTKGDFSISHRLPGVSKLPSRLTPPTPSISRRRTKMPRVPRLR